MHKIIIVIQKWKEIFHNLGVMIEKFGCSVPHHVRIWQEIFTTFSLSQTIENNKFYATHCFIDNNSEFSI
jgi:hypothetical protein